MTGLAGDQGAQDDHDHNLLHHARMIAMVMRGDRPLPYIRVEDAELRHDGLR